MEPHYCFEEVGMNRRSFLSFLSMGATAVSMDPERILWTPGKKVISIPAPEHRARIMRVGFVSGDEQRGFHVSDWSLRCRGNEGYGILVGEPGGPVIGGWTVQELKRISTDFHTAGFSPRVDRMAYA